MKDKNIYVIEAKLKLINRQDDSFIRIVNENLPEGAEVRYIGREFIDPTEREIKEIRDKYKDSEITKYNSQQSFSDHYRVTNLFAVFPGEGIPELIKEWISGAMPRVSAYEEREKAVRKIMSMPWWRLLINKWRWSRGEK
jgi:hypothetical protein